MRVSACLVSLSALSYAGPLQGRWDQETSYTATFDDLGTSLQIIALDEVGPYDGLDYTGMELISAGIAGSLLVGVKPFSAPNVAAYGVQSELLFGEPTVTSQYTGSTVDTFDLSSFAYGCVLDTEETLLSTALGCTVTVTGYKAGTLQCTETFTFDPSILNLDLLTEMVTAELPDTFKNIDTVKFSSSYQLPLVGATLLDNLCYTTHNSDQGSGCSTCSD